MKFTAGGVYMRQGMIDCCIRVVKRQFEDHKRITLKIQWFRAKDFAFMGFEESVTIYKDNMEGWKRIL